MRTELMQGAWLELLESWLAPEQAESLRADLVRELCWEQRHIVLFGKPVLQPRLIAWAGELPYRYSGQTLEPRPWPASVAGALEALVARASAASGARFNHVLVNRYRDGKDSMGYHADAEPELGPDPPVATLSLGETRRFLVRAQRRAPRERALALPLASGSLLVMGGTCQRHYRHAIAREADTPLGERLSLTFRRLLAAPR
jgi:alkylated DNA repair dioxygenase AlkB